MALPTPLTMKAVIIPKGSPAAQPREAPTLVPIKMKNFTQEPEEQKADLAGRHAVGFRPAAAGTWQRMRAPRGARLRISSEPPHIEAR